MDCTAGDLDRLSALPDDLLHVILGCLGFAPAVTRTAVLSRRWRHVWTQAKSLRFIDDDKYLKRKNDFAGFVDWVLAQRGDADMESLEIKFTVKGRASPEKINEWLRYAARRVVGSVDVDLGPLPRLDDQSDQQAIELPGHGRASSISLDLSNHRFRLPDITASRYEALTKLTLMTLVFVAGSTIGDFVASCCPRLRVLHIVGCKGLPQLVLRTRMLEELMIYSAGDDLRTMDVMAPNLRIIKLDSYHSTLFDDEDAITSKVARIVSPRLEEINGSCPNMLLDLNTRDLKSVRRLKRLWLHMHGKYHGDRDVGFWLLENCPGVEQVNVSVHHERTMDELVDLTSEGKTPFANVRTMEIRACFLPKCHLVASVSSLLMRCPHLTSLSVDTFAAEQASWGTCSCESLTDRYTIHGKIALESLQDVKITSFGGTDEEMQLVSLLFRCSSSIKRMSIALETAPPKKNRLYLQRSICVPAVETIRQELMKLPCADLGSWWYTKGRRPSRRTFTWTRDTTRQHRM